MAENQEIEKRIVVIGAHGIWQIMGLESELKTQTGSTVIPPSVGPIILDDRVSQFVLEKVFPRYILYREILTT